MASAQAAAVRSSFLGMLALHLVARHANEVWCTSTRLFRPVTLVELWMDTAVTDRKRQALACSATSGSVRSVARGDALKRRDNRIS